MERLVELERLTKDYFIESYEFLFTKKFVSTKKKRINLVFGAYNLEYNLILKDYRIFFDNKLKTKFKIDTNIVRKIKLKKYKLNKYFFFSRLFYNDRFYSKNFNLKDITIRPNVPITWRVYRSRRELSIRRRNYKLLNRKFFYSKALEIL